MAALVGALGPSGGDPTDVDDLTYVTAGVATAAGIAGLVLISPGGSRMWRTACLGAAAGTSFGMTATMIKAMRPLAAASIAPRSPGRCPRTALHAAPDQNRALPPQFNDGRDNLVVACRGLVGNVSGRCVGWGISSLGFSSLGQGASAHGGRE